MRRWRGLLLAAAVAGATLLVAGPAQAQTLDDTCGQLTDARQDLKQAELTYSASSFFVSETGCGYGGPDGDWFAVVHLTSFSPEVQIAGAFQDLGKYEGWSGFHVCAQASCPASDPDNGLLKPAGPQVDGSCLYGDILTCPGITTTGYGSWADVLPAGTTIPDSIAWYAEVRRGRTIDAPVVDRAPDAGTTTSARNTSTTATTVTATAGHSPAYASYGGQRTDTGRLLTANGDPIADRLVRITPVRYDGLRTESAGNGAWSSGYSVARNTMVRACFSGDGVHDPACTAPYLAGVKAFVSLDLARSTSVRRGTALLLKGVVRPRSSGQVRILVREDRSGAAYRLLRYGSLVQGSADSYYRISWTPRVAGRFVLRALWNNGTTAEGGVLSNVSDYHYVTVS